VRQGAAHTVFYFFVAFVMIIPAAPDAHAVQRAITEQAVEPAGVGYLVAWEIFALAVVKELVVVFHYNKSVLP